MRGQAVVANPDLGFNQSGVLVQRADIRDKLFFYVNAELERPTIREPTSPRPGGTGFGVSRVEPRSWTRSASG